MSDAAIKIALQMVDQATSPFARSMTTIERSASVVEKRMSSLRSTVNLALGALAAGGVSVGVSELIKTADAYTNVEVNLP